MLIFSRCLFKREENLKCFTACHKCQGNCMNGLPQVNSKDEEEPEDLLTVFLQESDEEDITEDNKDENEEQDVDCNNKLLLYSKKFPNKMVKLH